MNELMTNWQNINLMPNNSNAELVLVNETESSSRSFYVIDKDSARFESEQSLIEQFMQMLNF